MVIPLYVRSYPVGPSPVQFSLIPFLDGSVTWWQSEDGTRHQEQLATVRVIVPDGSAVGNAVAKSTPEAVLIAIVDGEPLYYRANEVYALARLGIFGFAIVK